MLEIIFFLHYLKNSIFIPSQKLFHETAKDTKNFHAKKIISLRTLRILRVLCG